MNKIELVKLYWRAARARRSGSGFLARTTASILCRPSATQDVPEIGQSYSAVEAEDEHQLQGREDRGDHNAPSVNYPALSRGRVFRYWGATLGCGHKRREKPSIKHEAPVVVRRVPRGRGCIMPWIGGDLKVENQVDRWLTVSSIQALRQSSGLFLKTRKSQMLPAKVKNNKKKITLKEWGRAISPAAQTCSHGFSLKPTHTFSTNQPGSQTVRICKNSFPIRTEWRCTPHPIAPAENQPRIEPSGKNAVLVA